MVKYRCVKPLYVDICDDDGLSTNKTMLIYAGEIFECYDGKYRMVGGPDSIRLDNDDHWIEIEPDTFKEHFAKVEQED